MEEYLREIECAATETLRLVWREEKELEELLALVGRSEKEIAEANARIEFLAKNPELDDEGIGTAIHWDTYFGPEKERYYAEKGRPELEALDFTPLAALSPSKTISWERRSQSSQCIETGWCLKTARDSPGWIRFCQMYASTTSISP